MCLLAATQLATVSTQQAGDDYEVDWGSLKADRYQYSCIPETVITEQACFRRDGQRFRLRRAAAEETAQQTTGWENATGPSWILEGLGPHEFSIGCNETIPRYAIVCDQIISNDPQTVKVTFYLHFGTMRFDLLRYDNYRDFFYDYEVPPTLTSMSGACSCRRAAGAP